MIEGGCWLKSRGGERLAGSVAIAEGPMSMVTQYKDKYENRRQKSQLEEDRIDAEREFVKWHFGVGPPTLRPRLRGFAIFILLPMWAIWAFLCLGILFALYVNMAIYNACNYLLESRERGGRPPRASRNRIRTVRVIPSNYRLPES